MRIARFVALTGSALVLRLGRGRRRQGAGHRVQGRFVRPHPCDPQEAGAVLLERREARRREDPLHRRLCASLAAALRQEQGRGARSGFAGVKGTFGVIRRPNGRLQVTRNGVAVYTYAHEGPGQVLCDNVDGWFVVRL